MVTFATEQRYAVNCVRTNKHEHVVMLTVNGRVIYEKCFVGIQSFPRVKEIIRLNQLIAKD